MICANIKAMLHDTEDSSFKPLMQNSCPSTPALSLNYCLLLDKDA